MKSQHTIADTEQPIRIDAYIAQKEPTLSRSFIQKKILSGEIRVNGKPVKKHALLYPHDVVDIDIQEIIVEKIPVTIPILFEDDDIIVIEKPTGVLVHPVPASKEWTLVDFLLERSKESATIGDDPSRPGIVHRLDRAVSGVMMLTKTQTAFEEIKKQFQERSIQKEYEAIVFGVPDEYGEITFNIDRSKRNGGKMVARAKNESGKAALTTYTLKKTIHDRFAQVHIQLHTGRTHQIRVHFASIDHPIVGDTLYQSKHYTSKKEYPRLFLHATTLGFIHPQTKEELSFSSPLPKEFEDFS